MSQIVIELSEWADEDWDEVNRAAGVVRQTIESYVGTEQVLSVMLNGVEVPYPGDPSG